MGYLVVTGVDKKSGTYHAVAVDSDSFNVVGDYGYVTADALVHIAYNSGSTLNPLNFGVDRSGNLLQNCGDFNRFSKRGSAVVLAEIKSRAGRTLGYRLLSCANNACVNVKLDEILAREANCIGSERFLQNGIVRNKIVACYPMHPFPVMWVDLGNKSVQKVQSDPIKSEAPVKRKSTQEFTQEQIHEMTRCENANISSRFIRNPKLSPAQMRVLWVAKSKGCLAESFADPRYSTDVMKFYADRLYDKQTVTDCSELLAHPELSVDELGELYTCVCQGVPYSSFIGMSATDINVKRELSVSTYWGSSDVIGDNYMEKATNVARRMKGFE